MLIELLAQLQHHFSSTCKETGFEVMEGLRFLASLPLCGTGRKERGEKNETFLSLLAPSRYTRSIFQTRRAGSQGNLLVWAKADPKMLPWLRTGRSTSPHSLRMTFTEPMFAQRRPARTMTTWRASAGEWPSASTDGRGRKRSNGSEGD